MFVFIVVGMAFQHEKNLGSGVYALKSVIDVVL